MSLTKTQLKTLTEKITSERERVLQSLREITDEKYALNEEDRCDEVDQAASDYERSQRIRFRNRDTFYVKKLEKALNKIADGEYAICEDCDCDIKFERLLARPTAELCISCKDEAERAESNNFQAKQSKSLGKQVNLAKDLNA